MDYHELPYVTEDLPGTGGRIREICEDFVVEEIPAYEPEGTGEHLFVNLTRRGMNTRDVSRQLAHLFELPYDSIGYAGLKDKQSVATQTFSVHTGSLDRKAMEDLSELISAELSFKVNSMGLHPRKIRSGHLKGNQFTINVTSLEVSVEEGLTRANEVVEWQREMGLPNFYGQQRVHTENTSRGLEIIRGRLKVRNRWLRRFLISSYIDLLCNEYLTRRIEEGTFYKLIEGDIAKKHSTGGLFVVEDAEAEQGRFDAGEISFTAPIYGPKMWMAEGPSGQLEKEILEDFEITLDELKRVKVRGTRRLGRLLPDIETRTTSRGLQLSFSLPKGAYATVVLREIMKTDRV